MNEKKTNAIDEDECFGDETKEFTGAEIPAGPPDLPESSDQLTEKKRPWILYITVPLLVAALVVLVYLLFFKENKQCRIINIFVRFLTRIDSVFKIGCYFFT